jgi:hypothetical protein
MGSSILLSLLTLLRNAIELKLKEWRKKNHYLQIETGKIKQGWPSCPRAASSRGLD